MLRTTNSTNIDTTNSATNVIIIKKKNKIRLCMVCSYSTQCSISFELANMTLYSSLIHARNTRYPSANTRYSSAKRKKYTLFILFAYLLTRLHAGSWLVARSAALFWPHSWAAKLFTGRARISLFYQEFWTICRICLGNWVNFAFSSDSGNRASAKEESVPGPWLQGGECPSQFQFCMLCRSPDCFSRIRNETEGQCDGLTLYKILNRNSAEAAK